MCASSKTAMNFSAAGGAEVGLSGTLYGDAIRRDRRRSYQWQFSGRWISRAILRNGVTVVGHCSGVLPTGGVIAWKCRDKNGHVSNSMWSETRLLPPAPQRSRRRAGRCFSASACGSRGGSRSGRGLLAPVANPAPAAVTVPTALIESGRRVALVIGSSAYRAVGLLPNPTKDAELVGAAFPTGRDRSHGRP